MEKIENNVILEINKIKDKTKKELKKLKENKRDELEWLDNRLRFRAITSRIFEIDDIEGEIELRKVRKIIEKNINNLKKLKMEI